MNYPLLLAPGNIAFNIQVLLEPHILWIGFAALVVIFAIVSFGLLYHWTTYSFTPFKASAMAAAYFIVSVILIATIFVSLELYAKAF